MLTWCLMSSTASIVAGTLAVLLVRPNRLAGLQLALTVLASLPVAVLLIMLRSGGHPTAQLNAIPTPGIDWWSLWMGLWPVSMLLLLGSIGMALVLMVLVTVDVIRTRPRHHVTIRILQSALCLTQAVLALVLIGEHVPDA